MQIKQILSTASAILLALSLSAWAEHLPADVSALPTANCSAPLTYGIPVVPGNIQQVCHTAYTSFYDLDLKIPRLVAYHETGDQTFGCLPRLKNFHSEEQIPSGYRAAPKAYANTGYDLGHNAPDQDMSYDPMVLFDSYSTANIAPQKPKMNREGWESLEEDVRAWAMERGEVMIYVGSIMDPHPQTLAHDIAIPRAFYKIIIDPKTKEVIGFMMNNVDTPKGDMTKFVTTISKIEEQSGITFPLPDGFDKNKNVALWHTSNSTWRKKHKELCKNNPNITTIPGGNSSPDLNNTKPMPLPQWEPGDPPKVRQDLKRS